ncbi:MAG TPA: DUF2007 domain-containing protein [Noviherbaspirillum sp.]|nr:DUF2007 domain-containing protein [Noviherbaspirillum sp.]
MKKLYEASNSVEAHMILNLLEQQGLSGRVDGEYLQGGIGDLPATGLVKVMVADHDYDAAKEIVDKWDAAQRNEAPQPQSKSPRSRFGVFAFGLALGIAVTSAFFRTSVGTEGIDHNRDDVLDEKWTYAPSGLLQKNEVDRNLDKKLDYVVTYGRDGTADLVESDDDFDGIFESRMTYRRGNPHLMEVDTDGDGYRDFKIHFQHGVIVTNEYIYPATGLPEKVEYFKLGKLTHAEIDMDKDGTMDIRRRYDKLGELTSSEEILP